MSLMKVQRRDSGSAVGTGCLKVTLKVRWDLGLGTQRPGRVRAGGACAPGRVRPAGCRPEAAGAGGRAIGSSLGLYTEAAMWSHGV